MAYRGVQGSRRQQSERGIGLGHLHPLLLESSEEENQRYQLDDLDVIEMDWLTLPYNTQKVSVIQEKLSGCEELVKGPLGEGCPGESKWDENKSDNRS